MRWWQNESLHVASVLNMNVLSDRKLIHTHSCACHAEVKLHWSLLICIQHSHSHSHLDYAQVESRLYPDNTETISCAMPVMLSAVPGNDKLVSILKIMLLCLLRARFGPAKSHIQAPTSTVTKYRRVGSDKSKIIRPFTEHTVAWWFSHSLSPE